MTNNMTDINNLVNNITNAHNNVSSSYNSFQTSVLNNRFIKKTGDIVSGTLKATNIDSNNTMNIGNNALTINIGNNNKTKTINIGGTNNTININNTINLNSHKIINVKNAIDNDDLVNYSQSINKINTSLPTKLSQLTNLNNSDININNHKIKNVLNGVNNNDGVTLQQFNSLIPTKLSDLTMNNNGDINLNNNKMINVSNGIDNNDGINLNQLNNMINNNKPIKLSQLTGLNMNNISLNNYKLTDVSNGIDNNDGVNLNQLNTLISNNMPKKLSQFSNNSGNVSLNNYKIINVNDATNSNDAVNLQKLNSLITTKKSSIPYSKITSFSNNNTNLLLGNGTYSKLTNNVINDNSINSNKLVNYPNDGNKFLCGDGTFKVIDNVQTVATIGKWELFNNFFLPTSGYIRQGTKNISSTTYPFLAEKFSYRHVIINTTLKTISNDTVIYTFKIKFINNKYFYIDYNNTGKLYVSTDAITWTTVTLSNIRIWTDMTYGAGIYILIAGGNSNNFATSSDGYNWTIRSHSYTGYWLNIIFLQTQNLFNIIPSYGGYTLYSGDGYNWYTSNLPMSLTLKDVAFSKSDNNIICFGDSSASYIFSNSAGQSWVKKNFPTETTNAGMNSWLLRYLNGCYVAICSASGGLSGKLIYSLNGDQDTWTIINIPIPAYYKNIAYGNGIYIITTDSTTSYFSYNLYNWFTFTIPLGGDYTYLEFCDNKFVSTPISGNNKYLIYTIQQPYTFNFTSYTYTNITSYTYNALDIGNNLIYFYNNNQFISSTDGISWNINTIPNDNYTCSIYGNNKYLLLSSNNKNYIYSSDGITWTQTSFNNSLNYSLGYYNISYGNGIFVVIIPNTNYSFVSSDGITWTNYNNVYSNTWIYLVYGNGIFISMADNSYFITITTDGILWNTIALNDIIPSPPSQWRVIYDNNLFVAVGYNSNICIISKDGYKWEVYYLPKKGYWNCLCYGNGLYIVVEVNSSSIAYSTNGKIWILGNLSRSDYWKGIKYINNRYVIIGNTNYYLNMTYTIINNYSNFNISSLTEPSDSQYWIVAG